MKHNILLNLCALTFAYVSNICIFLYLVDVRYDDLKIEHLITGKLTQFLILA